MQRVFNEATADEKRKAMFGHCGVKMGDYGTGGRVYTTRYRADNSKLDPMIFKGLAFAMLAGAAYFMYDSEKQLYQAMGASDEAAELAVHIPTAAQVDPAINGNLVFLSTSTAPVAATPPRDAFFGVTLTDEHGAVRSVTEYCQWEEIEHRERNKVGKDPDYCGDSYEAAGNERCQSVRCGGKSQDGCSSSECCQWKIGSDIYEETKWYSYVKGWHGGRINSLRFDNPAAYHNPSRDPAPPETFFAGGVGLAPGGGGLQVAAPDLLPAMDPWATLPILSAPNPSQALHTVTYHPSVPYRSIPFHTGTYRYIPGGAQRRLWRGGPQIPLLSRAQGRDGPPRRESGRELARRRRA